MDLTVAKCSEMLIEWELLLRDYYDAKEHGSEFRQKQTVQHLDDFYVKCREQKIAITLDTLSTEPLVRRLMLGPQKSKWRLCQNDPKYPYKTSLRSNWHKTVYHANPYGEFGNLVELD